MCKTRRTSSHPFGRERGHGSIRLQNPVTQETHLGQNEPEAIRPEQSGAQGAARLGLAHESPQGGLQPGLQQDDPWLLGRVGVLGCGALSRYGLRVVQSPVVLPTERVL